MKETKPFIRVVAGVALRDGKLLAAKRPDGKPYPRRWEFPGGKVERGETDGAALAREIREELGVGAVVGGEIDSCTWEYPEKIVDIRFLAILGFDGEPAPIGVAELRWVDPADSKKMDFLEGDRGFLEKARDPAFLEKGREES